MATSTYTQTAESRSFGVANTSSGDSPSTNIQIPRGETESTLTFYAPPSDGSSPWNIAGDAPPPGVPQRNYHENPHKVTIHDLRGRENDFSLNTNGFGTISNVPASAEKAFTDDTSIQQNYYPEVEQLLLDNVPGSQRIFIFDHTIRRSTPDAARAPVNRAHIDQTTKSAIARVHYHMGSEASTLLQGRIRLINVWRPLNGPVVHKPLAYADSRSVPDSDIVAVQHIYPHRTGETAGVQFTEQGKWYYWSGMGNDERILLQCYDSLDGARTPHTAFDDPRTEEGWPGRESIEVRALVFG